MNEPPPAPTDSDRRAAVCAAMASAPGLLRFAARFTHCIEDAEDAYQRAMEIALTKAPVVEPERFMAWLRTVLRNEAIAVTRRRNREGPSRIEDTADTVDRSTDEGADTEALAEWRHRYRTLAEALNGITESQRVCLILQAGGASYDAISNATGFSRRKVERSILEGRAALTSWENQIDSGEACQRLAGALDRVVSEEADRGDRRRVARHCRHCRHCRSLLRDRTDDRRWLGALAPLALVMGVGEARPPDPSGALAWFDRLSAGATVRTGNMLHLALETPGAVAAKAAAAAAAVVVAGSAGVPALQHLVDTGQRSPVATAATTAGADRTARTAFGPAAAAAGRHARRPSARRADPSRRIIVPVSRATVTGMSAARMSAVASRVIASAERDDATTARAPAPHRAAPSGTAGTPSTAPRTPVPTVRTTGPPADADATGAAGISIGPGSP